MWTFHPAASSLANFNDDIDDLYDLTLQLFPETRANVCHGITAHTLWRFHGEHQVNTELSGSFSLPSTLSCTHATKEASQFWGSGQFFSPFIIKRILGIKHIFPWSFGNKRMRLLTRVYSSTCNISVLLSVMEKSCTTRTALALAQWPSSELFAYVYVHRV